MSRSYKALVFVLCIARASGQAPAKPEPVDYLIRAKFVVTMDAQHHVIPQGAVAIRGTQIVAVGTQADLATRFTPKHTLDKPDALLAPGFIDTHTHVPMVLLRAIADDKRLDDWLTNYIFPAEARNVTAEFVRTGTRMAALELLLAGITTYTDMYYFEEAEADTAREIGIRGVLGETIIGFPAPDNRTWQTALDAAEHFIVKYQKDDLITPAVAAHAIYSLPDEALIASHNLAIKYNVPLLIHLAETQKERDDILTKRNMTPTQVLDKLGILDGRVVAAHSIWEDSNDLEILKRHNTGVAHCPSSNMKLADGVAHVVDMLKLGINVGLGNDGFAGSNDSADLIREMDIATKLQKITLNDPTALPAEQAFEMATMGGARVLGLDREIGSIEEGKRADLITISLANPDAVPFYGNVYSQIVYASKSADVEDVFINGKQIVNARHFLTINQPEVYRRAEEYRHQISMSIKQ
jgi:5-methylthioadenosine/S-adenosylhomocysteine deaminase